MSMGGSSGAQQTTSTPWSGQQPYLQDIFAQGQHNFASGGPQYFPNQTYSPFAPQTEQAMAATQARAYGSPTEGMFNNYLQNSLGQGQVDLSGASQGASQLMSGIGAGQQQLLQAGNPHMANMAGMQGLSALGQTANGSMLNSNPYLDKMFNSASNRLTQNYQNVVNPSIAAMFGGAGRTGSEAMAGTLGDAAGSYGDSLSSLASNIYGNNYVQERQNQLGAANSLTGLYDSGQNRQLQAGSALGQLGLGGIGAQSNLYGNISTDQARAGAFAPQASQMDWNNIDRLAGVGTQLQGQAQLGINDAMNRYNFAQNAPGQNLQNYASLIYGLPGGYGTQTQPNMQGSQMAGAIGGGLSGAAAGYQMTNNPYGAAVGGLLGAYGGYQ